MCRNIIFGFDQKVWFQLKEGIFWNQDNIKTPFDIKSWGMEIRLDREFNKGRNELCFCVDGTIIMRAPKGCIWVREAQLG